MKARSASQFLESYDARVKDSVADLAALLRKEPEFFGGLVHACVEAGKLPMARTVFDAVCNAPDAAPDATAYTAMILGNCAQRVPERALELVTRAHEQGVELEDKTWVYSQLIHSLGRVKRLADAEKLFAESLVVVYEKEGQVPRVLFQRMVEACGMCGEMERALDYADEMAAVFGSQSADHREDESLVGHLISAAFSSRSRAAASRLLDWLTEEVPKSDGSVGRRYSLLDDHYKQLIRLFGRVNNAEKALTVLQMMRDDIGATTAAYNTVLGGLGSNFDTAAATRIFDEMRHGENGAPPPDVQTFNAMIDVHGRARQLEEAFGYFRMMSDDDHRLEPNAHSYARLIAACALSKRLSDAEAVFAEMKRQRMRPNEQVYRELIKAAGKRKDSERAWQLWDEMLDEYFIVPTVSLYSALIYASSSYGGGDSGRAWEAYDHLQAEGLRPNLAVFNSLIYVCGETKDSEGAFRVLKEMGREGVPPDVRCYSRLLRACGVESAERGGRGGAKVSTGEEDEGVSLSELGNEMLAGVMEYEEDAQYAATLLATLERIKEENLPRNKGLYLALLRSAGRARQPKLVFRVFEEIKRESIKVDSRVYIHLLNACRLCGRFTACEAVFAQMKECKPPVLSTVAYNVVMSAALECDAPARALELVDELRALAPGNPELQPDRITYTTAMNAAGLALEPDRAFEFFEALQEITADAVEERTWCLLLKACGEAMDYERAQQVFKDARGGGAPTVSVLLYNAMMAAAGKVYDLPEMVRLFDEMTVAGAQPNSVSYNILMHTLGELKQIESVQDRFEEMVEAGIAPDAVTYSILIGAAGKALNLELAFAYYEQLKEDAAAAQQTPRDEDGPNLRVSTVTYINLINACEACGELERAFQVFEQMEEDGFIPNADTYSALLHACVEARREEEARSLLTEMVSKRMAVEASSLMALKYTCEANAYDECVVLVDQVRTGQGTPVRWPSRARRPHLARVRSCCWTPSVRWRRRWTSWR